MIPIYEPVLGDVELEYAQNCIRSGWISSLGEYIPRFENEFAAFCGCKYGVTTSNGTTALHLALLTLNIGPGDEVIVPSLTFIATANAIVYTGATPVFADSEKNSWNIDPSDIKTKITPRTRAIMVVHLYGHPADMDPILKLAKEYNLFVIEDAAEAHGALYNGRRVGSMGTIGCFSFYGNKIITTGEGGMCLTDDPNLMEKMRAIRDHGMSPTKRYWHPIIGYNYRITNIQAAIGVAQMTRIGAIIKRKREIAHLYNDLLRGTQGIVLPPEMPNCTNVYWMYSILVDDGFGMNRDQVIEELKRNEIDSRPFFYPIHIQPPYTKGLRLPVSEELGQQGINLPSAATLTNSQVKKVVEILLQIKRVS
jgi:perosamine synthetase